MEYPINKGAGNPIEFKGLQSQYLFIFAGGLVAVLLMVVILYLAGVSQWICIPLGILSGSLLVWLTFRLNARYGGKTPSPLTYPPEKIIPITNQKKNL